MSKSTTMTIPPPSDVLSNSADPEKVISLEAILKSSNMFTVKEEDTDTSTWFDGQSSFEEEQGPGKSLKRKLQTRAASKLYRQRKKAMELQLTERLQRLEDEKKTLIHQNQLAARLLQKLQEENARLRESQG